MYTNEFCIRYEGKEVLVCVESDTSALDEELFDIEYCVYNESPYSEVDLSGNVEDIIRNKVVNAWREYHKTDLYEDAE